MDKYLVECFKNKLPSFFLLLLSEDKNFLEKLFDLSSEFQGCLVPKIK